MTHARFLTITLAAILAEGIFCAMPARAQESSFQKGICYVAWEKEQYASPYSDKSLEALARTGAKWIEIVTTHYQKEYNSKEIFSTEKTPSDKSLIHAIRIAHRLGLKVMLKPHIDLVNESEGACRSDIGFQNQNDWKEWFSQYLKFILHYARIAEETDAELFCIGTELSFASRQTEFWRTMVIPALRKAYAGKLIYAANWDEYKDIRFWGELDYVGIDAYFPLVRKCNPSYEEIESAWRRWADEIESWQKRLRKQVIFTEIGYRSCNYSTASPWQVSDNEQVNVGIQSNCYQAAFQALLSRSWCSGIYWWYWKTNPRAGGLGNRDYTPQNKPAEIILSYWYQGMLLAQLR